MTATATSIYCTTHPDRVAVRYLARTRCRYCAECWRREEKR